MQRLDYRVLLPLESALAIARFLDKLEAGVAVAGTDCWREQDSECWRWQLECCDGSGVLKASASYSCNLGTPSTCFIPVAEEAAEGSGVEVIGFNAGVARC